MRAQVLYPYTHEVQLHVQVAQMLQQGAHASVPNSYGMTALHWAASLDDILMMDTLLSAGAHVDASADDGTTPLHMACSEDNEAAVAMLLRYAAPCECSARPLQSMQCTLASHKP